MKLREAIRLIVKDMIHDAVLQGVVKSVDKTNKTCVVTGEKDTLEYPDVRLMALVEDLAGDGITVFPKVGSTVLIGQIEDKDTMFFVVQYSEVESYEVKIGSTKFFLDQNGVSFNGGNNGGIVKWNALKVQIAKDQAVLSAMKTVLTGTPIPEPGNGSPSALQAALNTAISALQLGNYDNLQDDKVKH